MICESVEIEGIPESVVDINKKERILDVRNGFVEILVTCICCLIPVTFGIMLGWPSPMFLPLLSPQSPIQLIFSRSSLLAAFLMIGHIFGTFTSLCCYHPVTASPRHRLTLGAVLSMIGAIILWQADSLKLLYTARFVTGYGNGFAHEALKRYIIQLSQLRSDPLLRLPSASILLGVFIAYSVGGITKNRDILALVCIAVSGTGFVLSCILPQTKCGSLLERGNPANLIMQWKLLQRTVVLILLVLVQQFTGLAAMIVYNEYFFTELKTPYPLYMSIIYITIFLLSNLLSNFFLYSFNKKYCLIFSCGSIVLLMSTNIAVYYLNPYTFWIPNMYLISSIMYLYIIVHTVGLGTVTISLGPLLFPPNYKEYIVHFQMIFFCIFAILITKLFPILYAQFSFVGLFCMFGGMALFGLFLVTFCIANNDGKTSHVDVKN